MSKEKTIRKPSFVSVDERGRKHIMPARLEKYVKEHVDFLVVNDDAKGAVKVLVYRDGVYKEYDKKRFKNIIKKMIEEYDRDLVRDSILNEVYELIMTTDEYTSMDELNAVENVVNLENGILHITAESIKFYPHTPKIKPTIKIPCNWKDEEVPTPIFDNYMETLTNGDKLTQQLLLEFIGVVISNINGWRMKKALFMVGAGNTGKSQLKNLVEKIIGRKNCVAMDLDEIESRFGTGRLWGKRLAGSSDMSFMSVKELKAFKKLTGGDNIFGELKGENGFEYVYRGVLWFCMNKLPRFGGDDGRWVYDRIMVINCDNVIPEEKQDKKLLDRMYDERDGIIQKAVKALQTVIKNGYRYSEPDSIKIHREEYIKSNNSAISFWDECMCEVDKCEIREGFTTRKIYNVYQEWCKDNNNSRYKTEKEFRDDIMRYLGISDYEKFVRHRRNGNYYKKYALKQDVVEHYINHSYISSEPQTYEEIKTTANHKADEVPLQGFIESASDEENIIVPF